MARISKLTVAEAVARYKHHPDIEWIEPDFLYTTQVEPNDTSYPELWGLSNTGQTGGQAGADISAPLLWDQTHSAPEVLVAIIDTGVDHDHEDLIDNIFINPGEIPDNGIDDDSNGFIDDVHGWDFANNDNDPDDDNGHGTHVAGIAGATGNNGKGITGVAWNVKLVPLKFLDREGFGSTSDAIAAIDYALLMGVKIINASWGGSAFSNILRQAVQRAEAQGALFVAASGNSTPGRNNEVFPFYPSSFDLPNIIAVAATDHEDLLAGFANFGSTSVDLAAPGVDILSTRQDDSYGFLSGTSMATPHVSGALALYKGRFPEIGMAEAKALVLDNVDPLDVLTGKTVSGGRFNAFRPVANPDDVAPGAVDDLRTLNPDSTRIDLEWTASGDDANEGTATRFDVRIGLSLITAANFNEAIRVENVPQPGAAGTVTHMRVSGLEADTTYYFAVRSLDEFGNVSAISNPASGTTLGPPSITVTPSNFEADLFTGQSTTREMLITNSGEGEYIYEVIVRHLQGAPTAGDATGANASTSTVGTDPTHHVDGQFDVDVSLGNWTRSAAAGNFEATDSTAANGSRYSMHGYDATSGHFTGVHQELGDVRPTYAGLYVRSASVSTADAYFVLRDGDGTEAIFFFASNTGRLYVNGDVGGNESVPYEPHRWYHIEFKNIDFVSRTFDYHVDGIPIQTRIPFRHPFVEKVSRVDLYNFHGDSEAWWDEVLISTEEPPSPVSVEPSFGVVPAGTEVPILVTLHAGGLNGGDYYADILTRGNDPQSPQVMASAVLHVTGAPDVEVVEPNVDFGPLFVGGTTEAVLTVANRGTDELIVTGLSVDHGDFGVDATGFSLGPNETQDVTLSFRPSKLGPISGTVSIASNDPDQATLTVPLLGSGLLPPAIEVSPLVLEQELFTGQTAERIVQIDNLGFSDLEWEAAFPASENPGLEDVRQQIEAKFGAVTSLIPDLFRFLGGEGSFSIPDGGEDMYDTGNFISTNLGSFVQYTNGGIRENDAFGPTGRYFTMKEAGLFVFAADMEGVDAFAITGNLGADGIGFVNGNVLSGRANGVPHLGFVKRVYGTSNPSVNHIIVVEDQPGIKHDFSTSTNSDFHVVNGLGTTTRLYYLLYASRDGGYIDDETTLAIFKAFLRSLDFSVASLDVSPIADSVASGGSSQATVTFDATGLGSGLYTTDLSILSNDPLNPTLAVTTRLTVVGAPDITISESTLDFGELFIGDTRQRTLVFGNNGGEPLAVSAVATTDPQFSITPDSFEIEVGAEVETVVTFTPDAAGVVRAELIATSDDPDESSAIVPLVGHGITPPHMTLNHEPLAATVNAGGTESRTLTVGNVLGSDLSFVLKVLPASAGSATNATEGALQNGAASWLLEESHSDRPIEVAALENGSAGLGSGGDPGQEPESFTFRDDFEDGDIAGWMGGGFGLKEIEGEPELAHDTGWVPTLTLANDPDEAHSETRSAAPVETTTAVSPTDGTTTSDAGGAVGIAEIIPFSVNPSFGHVKEGDTLEVVVTFDGRQVNEGAYAAILQITSNDPGQPSTDLPLTMDVIGTPDLGSSRDSIDFGRVYVGIPQSIPFTVTNFGSALLEVHEIVIDGLDFVANASTFDLHPGESRGVNVTFAPRADGPQSATLTIHSNSPGGPTQLQLAGTGRIPPVLNIVAETLNGELFSGQEATRFLTLSNLGNEDLEFAVAVSPIGGAGSPEEILVFSDDLENGPGGWTSETYAGDNLWHRSTLNSYSPATSQACNIEAEGHYGSDSVVSTASISPPIDLRGVLGPVSLWFYERYETEPVWDQCMVDASTNGGETWVPLRGAYGSAPSGDTQGWVLSRLPLTNFAGQIVRVRFYFETLDQANNQFPGWAIDNISVTATATPWVAAAPIAGVLAPGQERNVEVRLDATPPRPTGSYAAIVEVSSNDPFRPLVEVPASLEVRAPARIAFPGDVVVRQSTSDYSNGGRSRHVFTLTEPPAGPGQVSLAATGNFDELSETATASAEAIVLGISGTAVDTCGSANADFPLSARQMQTLSEDGEVSVEVRNSPQVGATCPVNSHAVTLTYSTAREAIDFGSVFLRGAGRVPFTIANSGGGTLTIESISVSGGGVDPSEVELTDVPTSIAAESSAVVWATWTPTAEGPLEATLTVESDDPFRPTATLPLSGQAVPSPEAQLTGDTLLAALPPHSPIIKTRAVRLANIGQASLNWAVAPHPFAITEPSGGVLLPGAFVDLAVHLSAADLEAGTYTTPLVLETDDPTGLQIDAPVSLHVGEIEPDRFELDFTPRYATVGNTVEVALQLPAGLDPEDVVFDSIVLFDQLRPVAGQVAFGDLNLDGVIELIVQFDLDEYNDQMPRDPDTPSAVPMIGEVDNQVWFRGVAWPRGVVPIDP